MTGVLWSQLADPFRIALALGLVYTMLNTRAVTGIVVPLLAGVLFIAVITATTLPVPGIALWPQIATGALAAAVHTGVALGLWTAWQRMRR